MERGSHERKSEKRGKRVRVIERNKEEESESKGAKQTRRGKEGKVTLSILFHY